MLRENESFLAESMRNRQEKARFQSLVSSASRPVLAGKRFAGREPAPENPGMDRDPVVDARALVAERFPRARWAVVGGSVVTPLRNAGSDLDVVILFEPKEAGAAGGPFRASDRFRGWPVEIFAHTDVSLRFFYARERAQRRATLARLVAGGVAVAGDPARHQREAEALLAAGPPGPTPEELELVRYGLTDLLDDLVHAVDPGERAVIAATLWTTAAQDLLLAGNHWAGRGKWLLRELRALDPEAARIWLAAERDPGAIAAFARTVLDRLGGPLFEGYRAAGPPTAEMVDFLRAVERGADD